MTTFYKKLFFLSIIVAVFSIYITPAYSQTETPSQGECIITNAFFASGYSEPGQWLRNWYRTGKLVTIQIETQNCSGKEIFISLKQHKRLDIDRAVSVLNNKKYIVPVEEKIIINLGAGEEYCVSSPNTANCEYYIAANTATSSYDSRDKLYGNLDYECDGVIGNHCRTIDGDPNSIDKWTYKSDNVSQVPPGVVLEDGAFAGSQVSQACIGQGEDCYELYGGLADALGNRITTISTADEASVGSFFNIIISFAIGIAGIIVAVRIFYLGFKYIGIRKESNAVKLNDVKAEALKAILGLILLLSIYIILRTINPDLLNLTPRIDSVRFETGGDPLTISSQEVSQGKQNFKTFATANGVLCPGSGGKEKITEIAQSFTGKITYSMPNRGRLCSNNTFCLDCSGFVSTVYSCAGLPSPGSTTAMIFPGTERVDLLNSTSVNGKSLQPGDLLGWMSKKAGGVNNERNGHVIMYIGNGQAIEVTAGGGGKNPGKAVQVKPVTSYGKRITHIKRLP